MATFKNISPLGDLVVPALGKDVLAGETVDVTDTDIIESLRDQVNTWQEVSGDSKTTPSTPDAAPAAETQE
jgi:hypothetical protein